MNKARAILIGLFISIACLISCGMGRSEGHSNIFKTAEK
jgi:hypothetical protein